MLKFVFLLLIVTNSFASVCDFHKDCTYKFYNDKSFLTYFSTHNLNKKNNQIDRLVIIVHGALRNGNDYFDDTVKSLKKNGSPQKTIVIAPSFRKITDLKLENELYWGRHWKRKWKYGFKSEDQDNVSSFEVIDKLLLSITQSNLFPNLETIVITGHSAGGQFTQRYAIATKIQSLTSQKVLFVPSNPSSYMYLDTNRYDFIDGNFTQKKVNKACIEFNHYIYGPIDRPSIFKGSIKDLKKNFTSNNVIYLMSEEDNTTDSLDRSCEAMEQGENRFERAKNFWFYSKKHLLSKNHRFVSIAGIGHEHIDVYDSVEAKEVVFGIKGYEHKNFLYRKIGDTKDVSAKTQEVFILMGGGKNEVNGFREFLRASGGGDVVVISAKDNINHRYTHDLWTISKQENIKINSVETISILNKEASSDDFVLQKVKNAEAIFFTGGDQFKYLKRIKNTPLHKEIMLKAQKIPIAGTSAGLAIMGEFIFSAKHGGVSSDYVTKNPQSKYISIEHDFFSTNLLKNLITDTHFSERNREGRLLGFMYRAQYDYNLEKIYGMGVDEKSSLIIRQSSMRAFGGLWLYVSTGGYVSSQTGPLRYQYKSKKLQNNIKLNLYNKILF